MALSPEEIRPEQTDDIEHTVRTVLRDILSRPSLTSEEPERAAPAPAGQGDGGETGPPTAVVPALPPVLRNLCKALASFFEAMGRDQDGKEAEEPAFTEAELEKAGASRLSDNGARFIARFEGVREKLYNDPAGHCTIGIGHLVHRGPCNGSEPAAFKRGITKQQAYALLRKDAQQFVDCVRKNVKVPLNQNQLDALTSFTFNLGCGNLERSTLLTKLNRGDYRSVPQELNKWVYAGGKKLPGLVRRRKAEGALFMKK
ncbi:lysozyme [Candidatus Methylocalor cossyra]|uniref:Lysozyme n=1 Tax=Candidatus Methylocalor cossyra TaxID=3108543 RepID=A0ABM9NJT3_9GAMM